MEASVVKIFELASGQNGFPCNRFSLFYHNSNDLTDTGLLELLYEVLLLQASKNAGDETVSVS